MTLKRSHLKSQKFLEKRQRDRRQNKALRKLASEPRQSVSASAVSALLDQRARKAELGG